MNVSRPAESISPAPSHGARGGAAIAGVALAAGSVFVTFGASLVAMIAIWIAGTIAKHRQRPFTRGVSWLVGTGTVGTVLLVAFAGVVAKAPRNPVTELRQTMDSAAKLPQPPPPEWLRKITPPSAQRPSPIVDSVFKSSAFTLWSIIMGAVFLAAILAAYAGSLGWVASMLLFYAVNGAWLPKATPFSSPFDPKTQ